MAAAAAAAAAPQRAGPRLCGVPARLYLTAFSEATRAGRREKRSQGDDAAGRALRRRARRPQRRQEGRRMVQARRRARRPRGDVRARHVQPDRPRRPARPRRGGASSWPRRPNSAMSSRPTILRCSISKARCCPQDFGRAAELMRMAAEAGNPQAQYALATFYKEGRGVKKDPQRSRAPARRRRALGLHRRRGRIRHRAVQRHRRRQERDAPRASYLLKAAQKNNAVGAEPAGADVRHRPRHQGRSGRGRALAPDRQGRRRQRSVPRRFRAQDEADRPRRGRGQGQALDRAHARSGPTPFPTRAGPATDQVSSRASLDGRCGVGASASPSRSRNQRDTMDLSWPRSAAATSGRAW